MKEHAITWFSDVLQEGPQIVRTLIRCGDAHLALAQARFLRDCGHPEGRRLVAEAKRAIKRSEKLEVVL
jgi:hypothetical protein